MRRTADICVPIAAQMTVQAVGEANACDIDAVIRDVDVVATQFTLDIRQILFVAYPQNPKTPKPRFVPLDARMILKSQNYLIKNVLNRKNFLEIYLTSS